MTPKKGNTQHRFLALTSERRRRTRLILPKLLRDEATKTRYRSDDRDQAFEIIKKWADLENQGVLAKKETSLNAEFLHEVFGAALGYRSATDSPEEYEQEREFPVPSVGHADGALGQFCSGKELSPTVVIELKGANVDLDHDRSNGRTAVQQCWDYLNGFPDCPWGIVSNFVTIRLYHRDKTPSDASRLTLLILGICVLICL